MSTRTVREHAACARAHAGPAAPAHRACARSMPARVFTTTVRVPRPVAPARRVCARSIHAHARAARMRVRAAQRVCAQRARALPPSRAHRAH
eukprot:1169074-Pleurochrysis_carterae.AAC.1